MKKKDNRITKELYLKDVIWEEWHTSKLELLLMKHAFNFDLVKEEFVT